MRRNALGRGLGSLIPEAPAQAGTSDDEAGSVLRQLPITSIRTNTFQPRSVFEEESLETLTASIRAVGLLQPVLVRPAGEDDYELIAGERRWRAARRAGMQTIPAIVRSADDAAALESALVENLQREDLNALEEAAAYQQLIDDFGLTHEEVGQRVGKSRTAITNTLRLLQLPAGIQRLLAEGQLSAGHARALLGTENANLQESLARRTVEAGWSVRTLEEAVRATSGERTTPRSVDVRDTAKPFRPPAVLEVEDLLSERLSTRVSIEMRKSGGRLVIEFANLDDLDRIYGMISPRVAADASSTG